MEMLLAMKREMDALKAAYNQQTEQMQALQQEVTSLRASRTTSKRSSKHSSKPQTPFPEADNIEFTTESAKR